MEGVSPFLEGQTFGRGVMDTRGFRGSDVALFCVVGFRISELLGGGLGTHGTLAGTMGASSSHQVGAVGVRMGRVRVCNHSA